MAEWYKIHSHSTDPIKPPPPLDVKPLTPQSLYEWAEEHYKLDKETVKKIMQKHGIDTFNASSWWTYIELIKGEVQRAHYRSQYPKQCPICMGEIDRDETKDGLFGVYWGWKCKADKFHFMEHRFNVARRITIENSICATDLEESDKRPEHDTTIHTSKPTWANVNPY